MNHLVRNPELYATWQWEKNLPYLTPGLLIMKNKTPNCNKTRDCWFFFFNFIFSHILFHTSISTPPFSPSPPLPSHPWLLFSFLLSLYSCHDKCQTQSVRSVGFFVFFFPCLSFWQPSGMCAGTRLLRKHHIGTPASDTSVKVTEMFEGVVTSSQVPTVCVHLREIVPSHPFCFHPPCCCFKLISLFSCYHFLL